MKRRVFFTLFILLLGLNLIPNFIFLFTEEYSFVDGLISVTLPTALYLLLFVSVRRFGIIQLFMLPKYILDAFQLVILYLFGESAIAVDMFLNLATTNASEATELLRNLTPAIIGVCLIYIPIIFLAGYCFYKKQYIGVRFRYRSVGISAIAMGISIFLILFTTINFSIRDRIYPLNVIYNMRLALQKWHLSSDYPRLSNNFTFQACRVDSISAREIYVLVIGEASRANNWQLGGYDRPTNPRLILRRNLIYYPDALTQSNTTHKSVPMMLSHAEASRIEELYRSKSIITAMREAGFCTLFISNQTPNRSFTDYFASEADQCINIRKGNLITENRYDMEMLDSCRKFIHATPGDLFIVIHSYGSHFKYKERYPAAYAYFKPDIVTDIAVKERQFLINSYDNSIRYTDHLIDSLITLLQPEECTALLYCSDHGEDLLDDRRKRFLHASPNPTYYQIHIPILMWFSDAYITYYPHKVNAAFANRSKSVSTSNLFHSLLDMGGVSCSQWQSHQSLLRDHFMNTRRYYLTDHDRAVPIINSGLKKTDIEELQHRNIRLDLNSVK